MRAPNRQIHAPWFPKDLPWINVATLRLDQQLGRPVLVEFWDFCRPNSLRTLPYLKAWHERYAGAGLRVIGVHTAGFDLSADTDRVREAVARLGIEYPVVVDTEQEIWALYGNMGWPARYLFDQELVLVEYHYGEGGYDETERAIRELLGIGEADPPPVLAPLRPEDVPGAELAVQSDDVAGPYSGPYAAGGVWAVLHGSGEAVVGDRRIPVEHPGAYLLIEHPVHTEGVLELELGDGVGCDAVLFTPGLLPGSGSGSGEGSAG